MADKIVEPLKNVPENINFDKLVESVLIQKEAKFDRLQQTYKDMAYEQKRLTELYEKLNEVSEPLKKIRELIEASNKKIIAYREIIDALENEK